MERNEPCGSEMIHIGDKKVKYAVVIPLLSVVVGPCARKYSEMSF